MASLTLGWLHLVMLLGAVQGAFLTGVLATKRRNRTANRLLAAVMLTFSIGLASTVYYAAGLVGSYPHFFGVGYPLAFLYGPLIYLYAFHAADRRRALRPLDALHFAPFAAVVVFGLPIYFLSGPDKVQLYHHLQAGGQPPLLIAIADPLKFVSGIVYTVLTIHFLLRHRERVKRSYSSTERVNLRWLLWLGGSAAAIWTLALTLALMEAAGVARIGIGDDLVGLAVAALVYAIGYMGLRQPEVFRYETAEYPVVPRDPGATPGTEDSAPEARNAAGGTARYERSGLSDRDAARLRDELLAVMDRDEIWRDSDLTLADLAERLRTTPHKLSEVLNSEIGLTFYDFVNGYRVREVQRRIAAGEARALKMLSLALDAGFASKSTFNQVFKKHTNQTPSDFRETAGV